MLRGLCVLLLGAGLLLAQEEEDDGGIVIDETPPAGAEKGKEAEPTAPATARPARAPGKKPGTVKVEHGPFTLKLPDDWVLQEFDAAKSEAGWDVLLPGSDNRARLLIVRQEEMGDPRCAPFLYRDWILKQEPAARTEPGSSPVPHLTVRRESDGSATLYCFHRIKNNPYVLELACAAADFEQAAADMLAAAKTFSADVEMWPPVPEGYDTSRTGSWLVAHSPAVKDSLKPLEKVLKDQEKRFRKFHGSLPKRDVPIVVLVHASQAEAAKLDERAGPQSWEGFYIDSRNGRLFAVPVNKNDVEKQSFLASEVQGLLFLLRYGDARPQWIWSGERAVARAEWMTGRPLPDLHEGFTGWADGLNIRPFAELDPVPDEAGRDAWGKLSFFYMCMLHGGKFRKEYRAFLDELADSGDHAGAYAHHLAGLDPEEVKAATNDYIYKKLRPVKPK